MGRTALHSVASKQQLRDSWKKLKAKARGPKRLVSGVDHETVGAFQADSSLSLIRKSLLTNSYRFSNLLAFTIPKSNGGFRIINIPTVRDRIVQISMLEFLSEKQIFKSNSNYGFVRGRTVKGALAHFRRARLSNPYVVKVDIDSFFDTIPRGDLVDRLYRKVRYKTLQRLLVEVISCESEFRSYVDRDRAKRKGVKCGLGIRQGMPLSPFLANLYLDEFDLKMEKAGYPLIRYADDFVLLCPTRGSAEVARDFAKRSLEKIGLRASEEKTDIYSPSESVEFLGVDCAPQANDEYGLEVSDQKIRRLLSSISAYEDISFCNKNGVTLFNLNNRLDSMISGYEQAYAYCDNSKKVFDRLEAKKVRTIRFLIEKQLGIDLKELDQDKKYFLGLL